MLFAVVYFIRIVFATNMLAWANNAYMSIVQVNFQNTISKSNHK